jgi:tRNA pseudouridine38-40 synthase
MKSQQQIFLDAHSSHESVSLEPDFIRIVALLEYWGSSFHGAQAQKQLITVQSVLENALRQLALQASSVSFSGRTDAGVHAMGQVCHFDLPLSTPQRRVLLLQNALNAVLPQSIAIRRLIVAPSLHFHCRRDAVAKWYQYKIYASPIRSTWAIHQRAAHIWDVLDIDAMSSAFSLLRGTHCFTSFKNVNTAVTQDECHIFYTELKENESCLELNVVANRFLYKMVRTIVGQLLVIGRFAEFRQPPESILEVLAQRDRRMAASTAPAHGLTLMAVQYPPQYQFFADDPYVQRLNRMLNPSIMEPLSHAKDLLGKAS